MDGINTPLGAIVQIGPVPEHHEAKHPQGVMLTVKLAPPADIRYFSVLLSKENREALAEALAASALAKVKADALREFSKKQEISIVTSVRLRDEADRIEKDAALAENKNSDVSGA